MKAQENPKTKKSRILTGRILLTLSGITLNAVFSFVMYKLGIPLFLDTIGTVWVAVISGFLLPAICTAVVSSVICASFYWPSIYLSFFNAIIAIITVSFARKKYLKRVGPLLLYILILTLISSVSVSFLQYFVEGQNTDFITLRNALALSNELSIPYFLSLFITNLMLYFLEKVFISISNLSLLSFIPKRILTFFEKDIRTHQLVSKTAIQYVTDNQRNIKHPLHKKIVLIFVISSFALVILTGTIALKVYYDNAKEEKTHNAKNCAKIAAELMDPAKLDDYIKYGFDAPGYNETLELFKKVQKTSLDISYLYALKIEENGCRFIFDTDEENAYSPGELVPFDKEFENYLPQLFDGKEIVPVESDSFLGWLLSVYQPVLDQDGKCVCYVGVDVSMDYIAGYMGSFIVKVFLIMGGFFMIVISYAIWAIGNNMSYPISAIAASVDRFSDSGEEQEKLDENVRFIRSLDIKSGDEIQKLYDAICRMTLSQSEQIRDIRRLSESTVTMQDGLIITMADMVENRDSDTGAHVQKTSAYVKIIVEGLKKKGYYPQKITPKFMSDVVRSAPLHDVGKINISDSVLNKPGKLTDEEFAIMKTHTTAGKEILEKAISTVQGENYLKEARNMAAYHHERWDGKGYPEGLHGEVIPLSARIMAVADVFDALASPRVYKPAFPLEKALTILQEGSGTQFDPKCVEVFMDALPEVKMVLKKYNGGSFEIQK